MSERDELLSFAMELADEADKIAMRYFRRDLRIDRKPDRTFVTQADTAVEKALRERIEQRYPGHGVLAEEFGDRTATSAAFPMKSTGFPSLTAKPRPASNGLSSGVMSVLQTRYPFSRRMESMAR